LLNVCSWNEWLTLPLKYSDLPRNAQLAFTIWDIYGPSQTTPVGGTTISVFGKQGWAECCLSYNIISTVFYRVSNSVGCGIKLWNLFSLDQKLQQSELYKYKTNSCNVFCQTQMQYISVMYEPAKCWKFHFFDPLLVHVKKSICSLWPQEKEHVIQRQNQQSFSFGGVEWAGDTWRGKKTDSLRRGATHAIGAQIFLWVSLLTWFLCVKFGLDLFNRRYGGKTLPEQAKVITISLFHKLFIEWPR